MQSLRYRFGRPATLIPLKIARRFLPVLVVAALTTGVAGAVGAMRKASPPRQSLSAILGFPFVAKKRGIVVCYRHSGCSCGHVEPIWIEQAAYYKIPVLLINPVEPDAVKVIRAKYPHSELRVIYNADASVLEIFSPSGTTSSTVFQYGKAVKNFSGKDSLREALSACIVGTCKEKP